MCRRSCLPCRVSQLYNVSVSSLAYQLCVLDEDPPRRAVCAWQCGCPGRCSAGLPHRYERIHAAVVRVVGWAALRRTPTSRPALEPSWTAWDLLEAYDELCRRCRLISSVLRATLALYFCPPSKIGFVASLGANAS